MREFQTIPHRFFFCESEDWSGGGSEEEALNTEQVFAPFFDKKGLDVFIWGVCRSRQNPPAVSGYYQIHDFRFSLALLDLDGVNYFLAKKVRVGKAKKYSNYGVLSVRVVFNTSSNRDLITDYYLIKKDGRWVLHEVAPHGIPDGPDGGAMLRSDGILIEILDAHFKAVRNSKAAVVHQ